MLCLQAMRFPPKSYNKDLESAEVSYNNNNNNNNNNNTIYKAP